MLLRLPYPWTARQKILIVGSVIFALAALATLIYSYERHHRGPGPGILVGSWEDTSSESPTFLDLNRNGSFTLRWLFEGEVSVVGRGKWYAGGTKIYLRYEEEAYSDSQALRPLIIHIVDVQPDELRVRYFLEGDVCRLRRVQVSSAHASNQAMQRTADRHWLDAPEDMTPTLARAVADLESR